MQFKFGLVSDPFVTITMAHDLDSEEEADIQASLRKTEWREDGAKEQAENRRRRMSCWNRLKSESPGTRFFPEE